MRAIGKALPNNMTVYHIGGWEFSFCPSIGNPGLWNISYVNPRGWVYTDWVASRRDCIAYIEKRLTQYA